MAEKDETSMIGYDPLAWMHETEGQKQPSLSSGFEFAKGLVAVEDNTEMLSLKPEIEVDMADQIDAEMLTQSGIDNLTQVDSVMPAKTQHIILDSVQNIQNVSQLYIQLLHALENGEKIDIDASAITQIDTATLQLLLVLKQTAIKQQIDVQIDFPSDKFIEAANLLGLSEMLDVDRAVSGFF